MVIFFGPPMVVPSCHGVVLSYFSQSNPWNPTCSFRDSQESKNERTGSAGLHERLRPPTSRGKPRRAKPPQRYQTNLVPKVRQRAKPKGWAEDSTKIGRSNSLHDDEKDMVIAICTNYLESNARYHKPLYHASNRSKIVYQQLKKLLSLTISSRSTTTVRFLSALIQSRFCLLVEVCGLWYSPLVRAREKDTRGPI